MAVDDLGAEHEFHILWRCRSRGYSSNLRKMGGIGKKFSGGDSASASDAGRDNRDLSGVMVGKAGDDRVVAIIVCGLLFGVVNQPILALWIVAVGNPEAGHIGIICKMKAQRIGQAKRPDTIEGPNNPTARYADRSG
jgi:hypothetical protein